MQGMDCKANVYVAYFPIFYLFIANKCRPCQAAACTLILGMILRSSASIILYLFSDGGKK